MTGTATHPTATGTTGPVPDDATGAVPDDVTDGVTGGVTGGVTDTDVIIVGAGPVGVMLAGELRLAGVRCVVLEKESDPTDQSRALGFTARTIEVFDQRGLLPRFGGFETIPIGHFGGVRLDYREVEGGSYGAKGVPQSLTVAVLTAWARELGADIRRGWQVTGFTAGQDTVEVTAAGPGGVRRLRASWLVGCDGGRSTVRKLGGFAFPGHDATLEMSFAEVVGCTVRPRPNGERVPGGLVLAFQQGQDIFRVTYHERGVVPRPDETGAPSFEEVAAAWQRLTGEDISGGTPRWIGRFTDTTRQADTYRRGRVLLAGDAAHIHLPIGGQGMSAGIQDAVNLGWKLAAEVHGRAPRGLLDTYHSERHPVGARVLVNTLTQRTLYISGPEMQPLREVFAELAAYPDVRRHLIGMVTGLDIRYDVTGTDENGSADGGGGGGVEDDHPLLGRRLPDRELVDDSGTLSCRRTPELLHTARGVVLDLAGTTDVATAAAPWADRVDTVCATPLPAGVPDTFDGAEALLIRPDGYIAWVGTKDHPTDGLTTALTRWFGHPTTTSRAAGTAGDQTAADGEE
ncbi:FAD-dependent monooxygenase [Actinacidiphila acididurans]|uniref:FAD-dependent monooxygenase n=1 Tax=Actinacidiphila acididurans TaxID=2784346 RepID=A0ABS2TVY7_9ACTN|nr:FAD-dependent monooxygenase [Actinacidiphila acididurans]MBM9506450.1 FAD-dependent monooxygenase [Actinacidiphila acididurans]